MGIAIGVISAMAASAAAAQKAQRPFEYKGNDEEYIKAWTYAYDALYKHHPSNDCIDIEAEVVPETAGLIKETTQLTDDGHLSNLTPNQKSIVMGNFPGATGPIFIDEYGEFAKPTQLTESNES